MNVLHVVLLVPHPQQPYQGRKKYSLVLYKYKYIDLPTCESPKMKHIERIVCKL
jgi:hypothetical protein